uniref:Peptidase A2 domain-containing protein n=1 Tax=Accipiter nisus TaxID=211598 RepID=A0A8B9MD46_9AVES
MDLAIAESVILETSEVKVVAMRVWGLLGGNTSVLLIGRSSTTLQGLFVLPGVIDADYQGEIKIMVWTPMPPCFVPAGSHIALLVVFNIQPSLASAKTRGSGGFGSTGVPHIFWAQWVSNSRPTLSCRLEWRNPRQTIELSGIIDTGADVTVILHSVWPSHWPIFKVFTAITGIGGHAIPLQSVYLVQVIGPEGKRATINPFILPTPLTLWGWDCLAQWGLSIGSNLS